MLPMFGRGSEQPPKKRLMLFIVRLYWRILEYKPRKTTSTFSNSLIPKTQLTVEQQPVQLHSFSQTCSSDCQPEFLHLPTAQMVPYARFFASFASVRAHVQRGPTAAAGAARSVAVGHQVRRSAGGRERGQELSGSDRSAARRGSASTRGAMRWGRKRRGRPPTTRVCGFEKTLVSIGAALVITDSS